MRVVNGYAYLYTNPTGIVFAVVGIVFIALSIRKLIILFILCADVKNIYYIITDMLFIEINKSKNSINVLASINEIVPVKAIRHFNGTWSIVGADDAAEGGMMKVIEKIDDDDWLSKFGIYGIVDVDNVVKLFEIE